MTDHYQTEPDRHALWRDTLDYIVTGRWRELLENLDTTTPDYVLSAVCFGLDYSSHEARNGRGYLSTAAARQIMTALGVGEPMDRGAVLSTFLAPSACRQERGRVHWPVNSGFSVEPEDKAWSRIFGIEAGWLAHDRSGFLGWTEMGRNRYAAGESTIFTETSGQTAFAF